MRTALHQPRMQLIPELHMSVYVARCLSSSFVDHRFLVVVQLNGTTRKVLKHQCEQVVYLALPIKDALVSNRCC